MTVMNTDSDARLQAQMRSNIREQQPIQEWLDRAGDHLIEVTPTEIAEVYTELLRSVVGGVYAGGWRVPIAMGEFWTDRLEQLATALRKAVDDSISKKGE